MWNSTNLLARCQYYNTDKFSGKHHFNTEYQFSTEK